MERIIMINSTTRHCEPVNWKIMHYPMPRSNPCFAS